MKLLFINLCIRESCKPIPPVGLGYIMTSVHRAGWKFDFIDIDLYRIKENEIKSILYKERYDVIAMGCIVTGYKYVKEMCDLIKDAREDTIIIVGNTVASSIPHILLNKTKADIAVMGEGDITIIELLDAIKCKRDLGNVKGICYRDGYKIVKTEERAVIKNIDEIPSVNWDLFDIEKYLEISKFNTAKPYPIEFDKIRMMPLNVARGCAFKCTFCYHAFKGKKYRVRSPEVVIKEMESLKIKYNVNIICFWDELTFYSKKQCEEFVDCIIKADLGIYYTACCRPNLFNEDDYELALKLKESGCYGLEFSLESADPEILKAMKKGTNADDFKRQTMVLQKAGIICWTSLVIGYPQETEETIRKTYECCLECNIYPSTGYLLPQPGTPMYDYAKERGIITDEEQYLLLSGDRQDLRINLTNISDEKLKETVKYYCKIVADKLNLGLDEKKLIKTDGAFIGIKSEQKSSPARAKRG
ncbi:MAG: radical SAM protein [Candidatus Hydrogenedentota bacterium]